jgi:hypothetical protein
MSERSEVELTTHWPLQFPFLNFKDSVVLAQRLSLRHPEQALIATPGSFDSRCVSKSPKKVGETAPLG